MDTPLHRFDDQQAYQEAEAAYYDAVCAYFEAPSVLEERLSPQERQRWLEQQAHLDDLRTRMKELLP